MTKSMNARPFLMLMMAAVCVAAAEAPFEKEIRAFEAADKDHPPPRDAVLFIGSSSIRLWDTLAKDFPDVPVINRGFGGSQVADSVRYADRIAIPYRPRMIVMYAGDNDIAAAKSPGRVRDDFRAFVEKVRGPLPDVPVLYIAIKPSLARWKLVDQIKEANRLISEYAKKTKGVEYVDVFTPMLTAEGTPRKELFRDDGLHMNRKGYELWASILRKRIHSNQVGGINDHRG
jgi:lysophospholipase L1-like esterase